MNKLVDNIDILIVIAFLIINLIVGLHSGRNIKTIKEYALGNRNFSTATIAATIVATWLTVAQVLLLLQVKLIITGYILLSQA